MTDLPLYFLAGKGIFTLGAILFLRFKWRKFCRQLEALPTLRELLKEGGMNEK